MPQHCAMFLVHQGNLKNQRHELKELRRKSILLETTFVEPGLVLLFIVHKNVRHSANGICEQN